MKSKASGLQERPAVLGRRGPDRDAGRDRGSCGFAKITRDITERKQAEKPLRELNATLESKVAQRTAELEHRARQLQKLTLELSQAEDRERKRLAEILHDDLQQQLAAAKFHLGLLSSRTEDDPSLQGDRRPDRPDAQGRDRDLPQPVARAQSGRAVPRRSGRDLRMAGRPDPDQARPDRPRAMPTARSTSQSDALKAFLYKAAQEMLFNVVKHARVSEARMRVRRRGRCICLAVSDRGRGFDPQELKADRRIRTVQHPRARSNCSAAG